MANEDILNNETCKESPCCKESGLAEVKHALGLGFDSESKTILLAVMFDSETIEINLKIQEAIDFSKGLASMIDMATKEIPESLILEDVEKKEELQDDQ